MATATLTEVIGQFSDETLRSTEHKRLSGKAFEVSAIQALKDAFPYHVCLNPEDNHHLWWLTYLQRTHGNRSQTAYQSSFNGGIPYTHYSDSLVLKRVANNWTIYALAEVKTALADEELAPEHYQSLVAQRDALSDAAYVTRALGIGTIEGQQEFGRLLNLTRPDLYPLPVKLSQPHRLLYVLPKRTTVSEGFVEPKDVIWAPYTPKDRKSTRLNS